MIKKVAITVSILLVMMLCGCGESYPKVIIDPDMYHDQYVFNIGKPYEFDWYEITRSDDGLDMTIHFKFEQ